MLPCNFLDGKPENIIIEQHKFSIVLKHLKSCVVLLLYVYIYIHQGPLYSRTVTALVQILLAEADFSTILGAYSYTITMITSETSLEAY